MNQSIYSKDNLANLKKMDALAPEIMKTFWAFDRAAVAEGAIPVKYKELIAVGVALTTQCPYCIDIHSGNARQAGATDAELVEAALVAASLRAGAAVTHATPPPEINNRVHFTTARENQLLHPPSHHSLCLRRCQLCRGTCDLRLYRRLHGQFPCA